ncbi:hypothetical protein A3K73_00130 [Candidatus Pacearchaeota archaeon RBG_13_36_9]|nr:MAG: hypothetical protein A3K73_00130 [Candidatus Pacearchaeota archaeon RBG_13_36_9]
MLKNYLKYLESECEKFAKQQKLFDIVLYGSSVKGKEEAGDIDLLLVFEDENLKERVRVAQELKEILSKKLKNIDLKTINLKELFEKEFLARQGILIEGHSLLYNKDFSKRLGFEGAALFTYNLKGLNHNEKTKFTYALIGRNGPGMIKKLGVEALGRGAVMVPVKESLVFEDFLQKWKLNYKKKNILISLI